MIMQVNRVTSLEALAPESSCWNRLSRGVPFRGWEWLHSWWRHYGRHRDLYVLTVRDREGTLVGAAPWYLENRAGRGRVIQFLGSGEVCSDYMSLLSTVRDEHAVATAVADWLAQVALDRNGDTSFPTDRWDQLTLSGIDASDRTMSVLTRRLSWHGITVHQRPGLSCWRITLPPTWEDYLAGFSKNHRKRVRRSQRVFQSGGRRSQCHYVGCLEELDAFWTTFVDLHQRRRKSLGEDGCFASPRFGRFLREAAERLLTMNQLRLLWISVDGRPVAAEFQLVGGNVIYAYQSGMDPDAADMGPGHLSFATSIRHAIEGRFRQFDFLRGDEPYKARWHATRRETIEYRIVAPRLAAQMRHGMWRAGETTKRWIKNGLQLAGVR